MPTPQLRDYYLSNLGIVQYVPSEFCVVEQAIPATQPAIEEKPAVDKQPPAAQPSLAEKVPATVQIDVAGPEDTAKPAAPVETAAPEPELRFRISYWQLADILVFSALDYGQNPPQDQHQLLGNILQAVGRLSAPLSEPELMDWPLVPSAPAGADEARSMFSSFLKARIEQSGARWVLVMGSRAREFLLAGAGPAEGGRVPLTEQCEAVLTPGLDEMLADPACKRTTWQSIRFLSDSAAT